MFYQTAEAKLYRLMLDCEDNYDHYHLDDDDDDDDDDDSYVADLVRCRQKIDVSVACCVYGASRLYSFYGTQTEPLNAAWMGLHANLRSCGFPIMGKVYSSFIANNSMFERRH